MVSLEWTKDADFDINEILIYLSQSSPQYACSLLENVDVALTRLKNFQKWEEEFQNQTTIMIGKLYYPHIE